MSHDTFFMTAHQLTAKLGERQSDLGNLRATSRELKQKVDNIPHMKAHLYSASMFKALTDGSLSRGALRERSQAARKQFGIKDDSSWFPKAVSTLLIHLLDTDLRKNYEGEIDEEVNSKLIDWIKAAIDHPELSTEDVEPRLVPAYDRELRKLKCDIFSRLTPRMARPESFFRLAFTLARGDLPVLSHMLEANTVIASESPPRSRMGISTLEAQLGREVAGEVITCSLGDLFANPSQFIADRHKDFELTLAGNAHITERQRAGDENLQLSDDLEGADRAISGPGSYSYYKNSILNIHQNFTLRRSNGDDQGDVTEARPHFEFAALQHAFRQDEMTIADLCKVAKEGRTASGEANPAQDLFFREMGGVLRRAMSDGENGLRLLSSAEALNAVEELMGRMFSATITKSVKYGFKGLEDGYGEPIVEPTEVVKQRGERVCLPLSFGSDIGFKDNVDTRMRLAERGLSYLAKRGHISPDAAMEAFTDFAMGLLWGEASSSDEGPSRADREKIEAGKRRLGQIATLADMIAAHRAGLELPPFE